MDDLVKQKFESYPKDIAILLENIRTQILVSAKEAGIAKVEETLKWGEPSYLVKDGSTVRFDWKAKTPDEYCVYFNCQTSLVETFKEIYSDTFDYDGTRALVFKIDKDVPNPALRHCISMALRYHKIKHLPLLGE